MDDHRRALDDHGKLSMRLMTRSAQHDQELADKTRDAHVKHAQDQHAEISRQIRERLHADALELAKAIGLVVPKGWVVGLQGKQDELVAVDPNPEPPACKPACKKKARKPRKTRKKAKPKAK